jgi:hypothetical protein
MNLFERIFTALISENVKFMVVGGVAVNAYGYKRFTGDIDIIIALDLDNLQKLETIMTTIGYNPRIPVKISELANPQKLINLMQTKNLQAFTFISNQGIGLDLDIIVSESRNFDQYWSLRKELTIWDFQLPIVSIDDLIEMKKTAGRERDLEDIEALLKIKANQ